MSDITEEKRSAGRNGWKREGAAILDVLYARGSKSLEEEHMCVVPEFVRQIDHLNGNHPHVFLGDVDEGKVMMNIQDGS